MDMSLKARGLLGHLSTAVEVCYHKASIGIASDMHRHTHGQAVHLACLHASYIGLQSFNCKVCGLEFTRQLPDVLAYEASHATAKEGWQHS